MTTPQKEELENLVIRLENAGAKHPLPLACSEVREQIPQFARFLLLKNLFNIGKATTANIAMAADFDETLMKDMKK